MGQNDRPGRAVGLQSDPRFTLHHRQPRADKLDARQQTLCRADTAFADALSKRVTDPRRFAAFMAGASSYVRLGDPCAKCGSFRRRTRDRSCYGCHLQRGGANFERMKAGISPIAARSKDSHLDLLARQKAEREGDHEARNFGGVTAKRWPTGRLEITLPTGEYEADLNNRTGVEVWNAMERFPDLKAALVWAGWF